MKNNLINSYNEERYSKQMPVDGVDKPRINFILDNIEDKKLKILDIGCWDGSYAIRYKRNSNIIYGIESSFTAARGAKRKGIIVEQGDFMENDFFKNIKFDVIVAGEIIEHVFDTDLFVQKIRKMLSKNGILILTTPNVASLPRRILLLLGINPILENRSLINISAGHIRYFTFSDMYKLLNENKFTVINSKSDVVNFNNSGTLFSTIIPKLYKKFGRAIMVVAKKQNG
jgi:2-polyprenyl-3-methyl-5-hydroxy-6-metoxy-1,4-benzoquinol methylase